MDVRNLIESEMIRSDCGKLLPDVIQKRNPWVLFVGFDHTHTFNADFNFSKLL